MAPLKRPQQRARPVRQNEEEGHILLGGSTAQASAEGGLPLLGPDETWGSQDTMALPSSPWRPLPTCTGLGPPYPELKSCASTFGHHQLTSVVRLWESPEGQRDAWIGPPRPHQHYGLLPGGELVPGLTHHLSSQERKLNWLPDAALNPNLLGP